MRNKKSPTFNSFILQTNKMNDPIKEEVDDQSSERKNSKSSGSTKKCPMTSRDEKLRDDDEGSVCPFDQSPQIGSFAEEQKQPQLELDHLKPSQPSLEEDDDDNCNVEELQACPAVGQVK